MLALVAVALVDQAFERPVAPNNTEGACAPCGTLAINVSNIFLSATIEVECQGLLVDRGWWYGLKRDPGKW